MASTTVAPTTGTDENCAGMPCALHYIIVHSHGFAAIYFIFYVLLNFKLILKNDNAKRINGLKIMSYFFFIAYIAWVIEFLILFVNFWFPSYFLPWDSEGEVAKSGRRLLNTWPCCTNFDHIEQVANSSANTDIEIGSQQEKARNPLEIAKGQKITLQTTNGDTINVVTALRM